MALRTAVPRIAFPLVGALKIVVPFIFGRGSTPVSDQLVPNVFFFKIELTEHRGVIAEQHGFLVKLSERLVWEFQVINGECTYFKVPRLTVLYCARPRGLLNGPHVIEEN
jgi:hypothetical protein